MAELLSFTSSNVQNGMTFDNLITKLIAYNPDKWGYSEQDYDQIATQFGVSSNNLYYLPAGNYKLSNLPNSPFSTDFVNLSVYDTTSKKVYVCTIGSKEIFYSELTSPVSPVWDDITYTDNLTVFAVSNTAPIDTSMVWIDISNIYTSGVILLKYYNGTEWVSYRSNIVLNTEIYDSTNESKDVFKAIDELVYQYSIEFINLSSHMRNEFTLLHVSATEKYNYDNYILASSIFMNLIENDSDVYQSLVKHISESIQKNTNSTLIETKLNTFDKNIDLHELYHITEEKVSKWESKSAGDHKHNLDGNVLIASENIDISNSGGISSVNATLAAERFYKIDSFDILSSAISSTDLNGKYHNGNTLYTEDSTGKCVYMKIIDNTKFGTSNYLNGLLKFSDSTSNISLETLKTEIDNLTKNFSPVGYSFTGTTADEFYVGIQKSISSTGGGTSNYPMSTADSDLDIIMVRIKSTDKTLANYHVDKFNCQISGGRDYYKLSYCAPGLSKHRTLITADKYFNNLYPTDITNPNWTTHGLGRMIKVNTSINNDIINEVFIINGHEYNVHLKWVSGSGIIFVINPVDAISSPVLLEKNLQAQANVVSAKISTMMNKLRGSNKFAVVARSVNNSGRTWQSICYGNGKYVLLSNGTYAAYSTDGITWTEKSIGSTSRQWQSICYGNGKFVAVAYNSNIFAYSIDGITWTEVTVGTTVRNWTSVCYGNSKYIAVANGTVFAYSTDGIKWTEGTISSTSRNWSSVCYGNNKYIAVANSTAFAYSSNGTSWTEGTISSTSRNWSSVCYGNNKYVVVARSANKFAYSSNGTTWTEGTISSTDREWQTIYYGNSTFIIGSATGNILAYSTSGTTWLETSITGKNVANRSCISMCYGNKKYVIVDLTNKVLISLY